MGCVLAVAPSFEEVSVKRSVLLGGLSLIGLLVLADASAAQRRC